ncbi:17510_t:CDS:10, partial [Gigaspora margarita]
MSLRPKRIVFDRTFPEFKQDLERLFNFTGLDQVSGMNILVYDMCTSSPKPHTNKLFNAIAEFLTQYTIKIRRSILDHDDVVSAYAREWEHYRVASDVSSKICDYLNKLILKEHNKGRSVTDRNHPVEDGKYRRQTIHAVVELNTLTDNKQLHLYNEVFEKPYLEKTRQYYARESAEVISNDNISQYMKKANERLEQEKARNVKYCHPDSHSIIIRECETQYVAVHQSRIHGEFEAMISNERDEDCTMAYSLLSRITNGVNPLLEIFERYISNVGKGLIERMGNSIAKDPREYVESLMDLHMKYMNVCQKVFINDAAFVAAVDKAFRTIVNDTSIAHSPEVLARYCDVLLKKTHKGGFSEQEVEDKLDRMIVLFKYIDDKDVYQKFYSRMLAKRLIYGNSASDEAEVNMITRLKIACGVEYTSKLQKMFTDITISAEINNKFAEYTKKNCINGKNGSAVDFSILVLTAGAWPLTQSSMTEFQLPTELERNVSHFSTFYNGHHIGRRLTWLWHLSKADVKLNYLDKRYEFSVSLHQLGVLLLFNNVDTYSFRDIREHTGLNDLELKRVMKPMVDLSVFLVSTPGTLQDDTETHQENDATRRSVDEDRKLYLQASIVRVMKSRKSLTHPLLVQEVINQAKSRFNPSMPMIKKCIEQLLEKQYIQR